MIITRMRVNHLENPLGFRLSTPVFSWVVEDAQGTRATASRLQLSCDGATVADTGWADLDSLATSVELTLQPRTRYAWSVPPRWGSDARPAAPPARAGPSWAPGLRESPAGALRKQAKTFEMQSR